MCSPESLRPMKTMATDAVGDDTIKRLDTEREEQTANKTEKRMHSRAVKKKRPTLKIMVSRPPTPKIRKLKISKTEERRLYGESKTLFGLRKLLKPLSNA